jgi:hypothetical protein
MLETLLQANPLVNSILIRSIRLIPASGFQTLSAWLYGRV